MLLLIVDPAGRFALPESAATTEWEVWQRILKLSQRYHGRHPINYVLLMLNIDVLMNDDEQQQEKLLQQFTRQMLSIMDHNQTLFCSVIITQSDHLPGFNEFFADLAPDERIQSLGFNIATSSQDLFSEEQLAQQFQALIKRISDQFIRRLHQEKNSAKRRRILHLPLQLEMICSRLQQFLCQLPWGSHIHLASVFLTSSLQEEKPANTSVPTPTLENVSPLAIKSTRNFLTTNRPLFIQQTLKKIVRNAYAAMTMQPTYPLKRWLAIPVAICIIAVLTGLWHAGYRENIATFQVIQNHLSHPRKSLNNLPWLTKLNTLENTAAAINKQPALYYRWIGLGQTAKLQRLITTNYHHVLATGFQAFLIQSLTQNIQANLSNNLVQLYSALRTYLLMAHDHTHVAAINQWFILHWRTQYPNDPEIQTALKHHLAALLRNENLKWPINTALIQQARAKLQSLSLPELAFLELQGEFKLINVPIVAHPEQFAGIDLRNADIPVFYSANNFTYIYAQAIPNITNILRKGDWVLGTTHGKTPTPEKRAQLIREVRTLYAQYYTQQWLSVIANIGLVPPTNLKEAQAAITLLTDTKSSLYRLLKAVIYNVNLGIEINPKAPTDDTGFTALASFVRQEDNYAKIHHALTAVHDYLSPILNSSDVAVATFTATSKRFQPSKKPDALSELFTLAKTLSNPLQTWLNTIAHGTWQVMLQNTRDYLNSIWQKTIPSEYANYIENRYPIFKDSPQDISFVYFANFFKPNGMIQNFFQDYLQPFVNLSGNYWTWNQMDGETIGIPQETLNMFLRASLIQQMFFTDNPNTPSFKFTLVPTHFSPNLSVFILNLGGQVIQFSANANTINPLVWPGSEANTVTIRFNGKNGEYRTITTSGPWAWFRLLDQAQMSLQLTNNSRQFVLVLRSNDMSVTFQLYANNLVNPYLPNILNQFRCPKEL